MTPHPSETRLALPDLLAVCPFPYAENPHYATEGPASRAWIAAYNAEILETAARAFFLRCDMEGLVSRAYPYAPAARFRTVCDFVNLLFFIDEVSDLQTGAGAHETGDRFIKALGDAPCDGSTISRMMKDFKARFWGTTSAASEARFTESFTTYLDCAAREAELREQHETLPDLDAYMRLRRENSAVRVCFALIEHAAGIALPDAVFANPVFQRLHTGAIDMVCWANDLYSYKMELARGLEGNNVLTILMKAEGMTLQQAADRVGVVFDELVQQHIALQAQLPSWGAEIDADVRKYISAMECWSIGNLHWSFSTPRYLGAQREEARQTLVVRLDKD